MILAVEPSLKVPVAVKGRTVPTVMVDEAGVTAMLTSRAGEATVSVPLAVKPPKVAVTVVEP